MTNEYINGAIWIIVSSSATDNGYIFDWVLSVIVRICICISICVRERDNISSQKTSVSVGVGLVCVGSINRWFREFLCFSDSPFRQDVPDLTVVTIPQRRLFISAARYGPCGPSDISHSQRVFINNELCFLVNFLMLCWWGGNHRRWYVNILRQLQW